MKSIIWQQEGTCYLCCLQGDYRRHAVLHTHHVIPGNPGRRLSDKHGLTVRLCMEHHTEGPQAVHRNHENMRILQRAAQEAFEKTHTREEFMKIFGRSYL